MKTLLFPFILFIFAGQTYAQECAPAYPQFNYVSSIQISEDHFGIDTNVNLIVVNVTATAVQFRSDEWDDIQPIESWELNYIRTNKNGIQVYQFEGRSPVGLYTIPVIYDGNSWKCGYLTERLVVGTDWTTYKNKTIKKHINDQPNISRRK